jgi:hypothetical protein
LRHGGAAGRPSINDPNGSIRYGKDTTRKKVRELMSKWLRHDRYRTQYNLVSMLIHKEDVSRLDASMGNVHTMKERNRRQKLEKPSLQLLWPRANRHEAMLRI